MAMYDFWPVGDADSWPDMTGANEFNVNNNRIIPTKKLWKKIGNRVYVEAEGRFNFSASATAAQFYQVLIIAPGEVTIPENTHYKVTIVECDFDAQWDGTVSGNNRTHYIIGISIAADGAVSVLTHGSFTLNSNMKFRAIIDLV